MRKTKAFEDVEVSSRRRIQRAFLEWLAANSERFAIEIRLGRRTDRLLEFSFAGINRAVGGWLVDHSLSVSVYHENDCWDLLLDLDASPKRVAGGCVCAICTSDEQRIFMDRPSLWADHLFEPFLEWVNAKLAKANWLVLLGEPGSSTSVEITVECPAENSERDGDWRKVTLSLRGDDVSPAFT